MRTRDGATEYPFTISNCREATRTCLAQFFSGLGWESAEMSSYPGCGMGRPLRGGPCRDAVATGARR